MSIAPPSRNPTNDGSLQGVLDLVARKLLQSIDDMLPAQVIAYDRASNLANVQPYISLLTTDGVVVRRAQIVAVPVLRMGGNGVVMSFSLSPGDPGWIKANDRDISLYTQNQAETVPNTGRMHSFSDGVFIPDAFKGVTINSGHINHAVIQSLDGTSGAALITDNCIIDCFSTTKAFKLPRMTHAQRDAIPSPLGGMMVYVTDSPTGVSTYIDGTGWT